MYFTTLVLSMLATNAMARHQRRVPHQAAHTHVEVQVVTVTAPMVFVTEVVTPGQEVPVQQTPVVQDQKEPVKEIYVKPTTLIKVKAPKPTTVAEVEATEPTTLVEVETTEPTTVAEVEATESTTVAEVEATESTTVAEVEATESTTLVEVEATEPTTLAEVKATTTTAAPVVSTSSSSSSNLSSDQQGALDAHNVARSDVGNSALTWDDSLAADAQTWADHLVSVGSLVHAGAEGQGENLFMQSGEENAFTNAANAFVSEKKVYSGEKIGEGDFGSYGHYTQVVWKSTTKLGMAVASGNGQTFVVARYAQPGNLIGATPF